MKALEVGVAGEGTSVERRKIDREGSGPNNQVVTVQEKTEYGDAPSHDRKMTQRKIRGFADSDRQGASSSGISRVADEVHKSQAASASPSTTSHALPAQKRTWWEWGVSGVSTICAAAKGTVMLVTDVGMVIVGGVVEAGRQVIEAVKDPIGTAKKIREVGESIVNQGCEIWKTVRLVGESVLSGLKHWSADKFNSLKDAAIWSFNNPSEAAQRILSNVVDGFNATLAFCSRVSAPALDYCSKVLSGEIPFARFLSDVGGALVTGFKIALEFLPLTPLVRSVYHGVLALAAYGQGDKAAFAHHAGEFAINAAIVGFIVATAPSGGLAALFFGPIAMPYRYMLTFGAKDCFRRATTKMCEKVSAGTFSKLSTSAASVVKAESPKMADELMNAAKNVLGRNGTAAEVEQRMADMSLELLAKTDASRAARQVGKSLHEGVEQYGDDALNRLSAKESAFEIGSNRWEGLSSKLGVKEHVDTSIDDVFSKLQDMSRGEKIEFFRKDIGLSWWSATKAAGEAEKVLLKAELDDITAALGKSIEKDVWLKLENCMKDPFRADLGSLLRGVPKNPADEALSKQLHEVIDRQVKKMVKDKDFNPDRLSAKELKEKYIKELVDDAWDGYRSGGRKSFMDAAKQGIESAIARLKVRARAALDIDLPLPLGVVGDGADSVNKHGNIQKDVEPSAKDLQKEQEVLANDKSAKVEFRESYQNELLVMTEVGEGGFYEVAYYYDDTGKLKESRRRLLVAFNPANNSESKDDKDPQGGASVAKSSPDSDPGSAGVMAAALNGGPADSGAVKLANSPEEPTNLRSRVRQDIVGNAA
jgi:hypothetical protein